MAMAMAMARANSPANTPASVEIVAVVVLLKEAMEQDVSEADRRVVAWPAGLKPGK